MAEKCKGEWGPAKNRQHCKRPATHDGYCIYHWPSPEKDEEFLEVLKQDVRTLGDPADLSGAIFYEVGDTFNCAIKKSIWLQYAEFRREVVIERADFTEYCRFSNARFVEPVTMKTSVTFNTVLFDNTVFCKGAHFSSVNFQYVDFSGSVFGPKGDTTFEECRFASHVSFKSGKILCPCSFHECRVDLNTQEQARVIDFTGCKISGLRFIDSKTYRVGNMNLDHAEYDKRFLSSRFGRPVIRDELEGISDWRLVEFYRHMHTAKYDSSQFEEASEFYVSFMAARKSSEKRTLLNRFIMRVYGSFARYGQSIVRPLVLLLAAWTIVSVLLFMFPDFTSRSNTPISIVDSESTNTFWDAAIQYGKAFVFTVSHSTIDRNSPMTPAVTCWQGVMFFILFFVNILLASFVAVGIKHQVRPTLPVRKT